jgi:arylsulfatase A-like enzyme
MTIDFLPTFAHLAGAPLPDRPIDGADIWPLWSGQPGATNPHPAYAFWYNQNDLQAIRSGSWKLVLPHRATFFPRELQGQNGARGLGENRWVGLELYDLDTDPGETRNLAAERPEILGKMLGHAEEFRAELGDTLTRRTGRANREPARWE